mmetsp:Transcript_39168/g.118345  ORF Transcript_39168/g.118345 Transcript_39168/m.118345 type:complete len:231 (+) Transcript_39168:1353-2045(+)
MLMDVSTPMKPALMKIKVEHSVLKSEDSAKRNMAFWTRLPSGIKWSAIVSWRPTERALEPCSRLRMSSLMCFSHSYACSSCTSAESIDWTLMKDWEPHTCTPLACESRVTLLVPSSKVSVEARLSDSSSASATCFKSSDPWRHTALPADLLLPLCVSRVSIGSTPVKLSVVFAFIVLSKVLAFSTLSTRTGTPGTPGTSKVCLPFFRNIGDMMATALCTGAKPLEGRRCR